MLKGEIIGILSGSFVLCTSLFLMMAIFKREEYIKFLILAIIFLIMTNMLLCYYLGYYLEYNKEKHIKRRMIR